MRGKAFHNFALIGVGFITATGIIIAAILRDEKNEGEKFRCYTAADEKTSDIIRDDCYEDYDRTYNSNFPLYAFVLCNSLPALALSVAYSMLVIARVDEIEDDNKEPLNQVEHVVRQSAPPRCKVFTAYIIQLGLRVILLIVACCLQWPVLYPTRFPDEFSCPTTQAHNSTVITPNSTTTAATTTSVPSVYTCNNPLANSKTGCGIALFFVNALVVVFLLVEEVYLAHAWRADKTFTEDRKFCSYLSGKENLKKSIKNFVANQKRQILQGTENIKPLIPRTFGENENTPNLKLDDIFVDLVIQTGRKIYDFFDKARHEVLASYAKPGSSITLGKAEQIFAPNEDKQDPRTILAVGRAGIGKTILATKILRDWANGVLSTANQAAKSFDFVFLLQFRWLNFEKDIPLMELLSRSPYSVDFTDEIFQHVKKNPEKVLLVFDGLDEAKELGSIGTEQEHNNGTSAAMPVGALFAKLASGKLLNGATVLTTTRSTVLPGVVSRFYSDLTNQEKLRLVEILGFTPERVQEYVNKFVPEAMKDHIWNHISANANLLSLCYIPVNCFIVCSNLMNALQNQGQADPTQATTHTSLTLPITLTEIYKGALNCFMLSRHSLYRNEKPRRTEFDPNSKFRASVEETLNKLGKLAMRGLEKGRLIFDETEIMESAQLTQEELKDMVESSLLHHLPESKTGASKYQEQYCFIHLTFQEFLAARVIVHKTPKELADFTKFAMYRKDSKMELVLQFVAGLLRGNENPDCIDSLLQPLIRNFLMEPEEVGEIMRQGMRCGLLLVQCLFEFHSDDKTGDVICNKLTGKGTFVLDSRHISDSDCSSLVFFFKHLHEKELNLINNYIGPHGCAELAKLVKDGNLKTLDIGFNNVGDQGLKSVSEALQSEECKLQTFHISNIGITAVGAKHLSNSLKTKQCQLTKLYLHQNQLTDESAKYLSDALKSEQCQLAELSLHTNQLTAEGAKYLSDALKSEQCQLTELYLHTNQLTAEGAKYLSDAMKSEQCQLTELYLSGNQLTAEGAKYLSDAMKSEQCQLTELYLSGNQLTAEGAKYLSDAMKSEQCQLTVLYLGSNQLTDEGAKYLSDAMKSEQCQLTVLYLGANQLTDEGAKYLSGALKSEQCQLTELYLPANQLTDEGAKYLGDALKSGQCQLKELYLAANQLTIEGAKYLSDALKSEQCQLTGLDFG